MKCNHCQFVLPDDATFCGNCGQTVVPVASAPGTPPPPPPPAPPAPPAPPVPPAPPSASAGAWQPTAATPVVPPTVVQPVAAPPAKKRRTGLLVGGIVVILGLGGAAFALLSGDDDKKSTSSATTAAADVSAAPTATAADVATTVPATEEPTTTTEPPAMPKLVGMTEAEAKAALKEIGVTTATFTKVPYAGPAGVVVDQAPEKGITDLAKVEVVVSQVAPMADYAGQVGADAKKALEALGARVTLAEVFDPAATVGNVLGQTPGVGEPTPLSVTLQVAGAGTEVYLDEVSTTTGSGCREGSAKVNTYQSAHAVYCRFGNWSAGSSGDVEYDLNRSANLLRFTGGLDDSSPSEGRVRLVIYGDGIKLWEREYGLGESTEESISVTGVLRLRIEMVLLVGSGSADTVGVLGDIRVAGDQTLIANVPRKS